MVKSPPFFACSIVLSLFFTTASHAKIVQKELVVEEGKVNLSGAKTVAFALTVNGTIPAPTLEFTEGDQAEITVTNHSKEEISIHWHGMLLPFEMDGVAHLTTPSIFPGKSYVFRFPIRQSGTYWYHSHSGDQEQRGVFGAIVIHPKKELYHANQDLVVMLNDWTDENPANVGAHLKKDGDYYQIKKNTVRSIVGALGAGRFGAYVNSLWTRMGGMDLSDVGYDAFLINGKRNQQLLSARPGQTVRLRVINGAASTYFYVNLGERFFKVIAADGQYVSPVETKELLMGMAETYDILFRVPEQKNFEFKATAQDTSGSARAWIGMGETDKEREFAPERPQPDLYEMHHHGGHAGHGAQDMDHGRHFEHKAHATHEAHGKHGVTANESVARTAQLDYGALRALTPSEFDEKAPRYEMTLELDGNMARYNWMINGHVISEDKYIDVSKGDIVRFVFVNKSMMHHPMHLHGHFFRVLNQNGKYSPLKHTVDVGPYQTRTIEFMADEPGLWMLHCHNMYHLGTGMAKIVRYRGVEVPHEAMSHVGGEPDPHSVDPWYHYGALDTFSNDGRLYLRASQTRYQVDGRIESRRDHGWTAEGEVLGRRWLSKYWNVFVGGQAFHRESSGVIGTSYILPLLIETSLFLDSGGKLRLDAAERLQWTPRLYSDLDLTLRDSVEPEWSANLMYAFSWNWAVGVKAVNDGYWGAGLSARF